MTKLLLTNDDGIDAPGLRALLAAAKPLGEPVVVAPAEHQSGCSHLVTWRSGVRIEPRGEAAYAVHGTPADCVRMALLRLATGTQWVLSGINDGGNLGADTYYSGTVAAVREAVLHGWPGIAVSHYCNDAIPLDWDRVVPWVTRVLRELMSRPVEPGTFYNVNLPHLQPGEPEPAMVFCPLDPHPLPLTYRHEEEGGHFYDGSGYHLRERKQGSDVDVCFGGRIAVTQIRLF